MRNTIGFIGLIFCLLGAPPVEAADYLREKKWADEITPAIVVGDPVYLKIRSGHQFLAIYTVATNAKAGLVIVHGMGVHPDWGLIGVLRSELPDHGYTSLSVQMPVLSNEAKPEDYASTFGEASERIAAAVNFFTAQGLKKIFLVSHSMGSRMVRHHLITNPQVRVSGWVSIGMGGNEDYKDIILPVLDLYGENDTPAVLQNAKKRAVSIAKHKASQQTTVPGAEHFFNTHRGELLNSVRGFLDRVVRLER